MRDDQNNNGKDNKGSMIQLYLITAFTTFLAIATAQPLLLIGSALGIGYILLKR